MTKNEVLQVVSRIAHDVENFPQAFTPNEREKISAVLSVLANEIRKTSERPPSGSIGFSYRGDHDTSK